MRLLLLTLMLTGCATFNKGVNMAENKVVDFYSSYCRSTPEHRHVMLSIELNARLLQENGAIQVCCPDDDRQICNNLRSHYEALIEIATQ